MQKYRIAVTWEMCGYIDVEADSLEIAMENVKNDPDNFCLPADGGNYVDDSFVLSTEDVDEMKVICGYM